MDNLTQQSSELRSPRRLGEILDQSFPIAFKVVKVIFPILLLAALLTLLDSEETFAKFEGKVDNKHLSGLQLVIYILRKIAGGLTGLSIYLLTVPMAAEAWNGREVKLNNIKKYFSFILLLRMLALWIRVSIIGGLGLLLFVIPGAIYILNRCLAFFPLFLEGLSVKDSLLKSKTLMLHGPSTLFMSETQWRATGLFMVAMILSFLPMIIFGAAYTGSSTLGKAFTLGIYFLFTLAYFAASIYSNVAILGLYFDLRSRTEGNDLLEAIDKLRQTATP